MKKSNKSAERESVVFPRVVVGLTESVQTVDQDKLQVMDELNKEWVQAWRKEFDSDRMQKMKNARPFHREALSSAR